MPCSSSNCRTSTIEERHSLKVSSCIYIALATFCLGMGLTVANTSANAIPTTTSGLSIGRYRTKSFHGYRIEARNYVRYNSEYNVKQHAILSKYRPTQKSKVIFKYGTKIVPTRHPWICHHGKNDNLMTMYQYSKGAWHKMEI